jgi:hypothetical protein
LIFDERKVMTSDTRTNDNPIPELSPAPELRQFDRFIGSWKLSGNLVGSDKETIKGEATYEWLPGGFFLQQHVQLDFAGFAQIDSYEMISYDTKTGTFPSMVYSNMSPEPLPYRWRIDGDTVTITVTYAPLDATYTGRWSDDGTTFSGGWRPNPGADETVNVPYDIRGSRA